MGVEIEKKYLVRCVPPDLERFPCREIIQGYLCRKPAVRVRRENGSCPEGERFTLTYKGLREAGRLAQEEYNLSLTKEACAHLMAKADGVLIHKKRYLLPLNADAFPEIPTAAEGLVIELDVFSGVHEGLILAEVEFRDEETAQMYRPADWFGEEVTGDPHYSNAWLSENPVRR